MGAREWAGAEILLENKYNLTATTKAFLQAIGFTLLLSKFSVCSCLREDDNK